ncbi:MAG TPA: hypothetical protein VNQ56_12815 [Pseudolabrys sp.]|nr:hypothetical protein [Pseudolabrys sp.]
MKLTLCADVDELRSRAIAGLDAYFNSIAIQNAHRDLVHALKRQMAREIIEGGEPNPWIEQEAAEAETALVAYARLIDGRSDALAERELLRRRLKAKIRVGTVQEIREIMSQYNGAAPSA